MKKTVTIYIVCANDDYECGVSGVYADEGAALDARRCLFLANPRYTVWCEDNGYDPNLNASVSAYMDSASYENSPDRYWIEEHTVEVDV